MSNLQKTLNSLQPYVIGIRFIKTSPVVDVVLNEGWTILEDANIQKVKGDEGINYYMIYSDKPEIGLDDLLAYVERIIKANLEREKKHDLLKAKVNELKEIFKKNSLTKLQRLKFSFGEEDLVPRIDEMDVDIDDTPAPIPQPQVETPIEEEVSEEEQQSQPSTYLDENNQPIELTDEEREMIEEEKRAEKNRKMFSNRKQTVPAPTNMAKKVELPPKKKIEMAIADRDYETDCDCGPNEACDKCIDKKDL